MPGVGDESPAARLAGAEQAVQLLLRINAPAVMATASNRRQWILKMTPDQWVNTLANFGAALQNIPLSEMKFSFNARVGPYAAPAAKHHKQLLTKALETMQAILQKPDGETPAAMRKVGLAAAGGINMIHAWENGSGRLARWMSNILEQGFDGSSESQSRLKDVATSRLIWNTDPSNLTAALTRMVEDEVLGTAARPGIPRRTDQRDHRFWTAEKLQNIDGLDAGERRRLARALNDETSFLALYKTLRDGDKVSPALLASVTGESGQTITTTLKAVESVSVLNANDARALLATSEHLRAWRVNLFLEQMESDTPHAWLSERGTPRSVGAAYEADLVEGSSLLAPERTAALAVGKTRDQSQGIELRFEINK